MPGLRTHYDNLQVARKAAPEVIAAAYRSLSLKYHPDRNPGDAKCERIMRIVNNSYAVLSDPAQRRAHDLWIAKMEALGTQDTPQASESSAQPEPFFLQRPSPPLAMILIWFLIGGGVLAFFFWPLGTPKASGLPPYDATRTASEPPPVSELTNEIDPDVLPPENMTPVASEPTQDVPAAQPAYARPTTAPNGSPWPESAGYVIGYPRLASGGLSRLTIDNTASASDVFVKLVVIEPDATRPVRHLFIPANSLFVVEKLAPGDYDLRYMNLNDGSLLRSESFTLKEEAEAGGMRFSKASFTLYKVANGNTHTFPLLPSEF